ncbi:hypothetical protein BC939DRAFT_517693, partial [Gamsiella multidivaricata]|uniref:uncharacterized protein n=1 Tax=Gamsiella multidivaricata TaxID=101098 RepID=UPI002220E9F0
MASLREIMREPNFSFPNQNRAAICITSSIYDRRALDCTDYVPIINTLTNLAYLTGSTPTIREFITKDGGLERLVTILKNTKVNDKKNGLKWTLAFQCVVNIGVRGTEHIRKRVVQAGMIPVIVNVLESFFTVLKSVSDENERKRLLWRVEAAQQNSQPMPQAHAIEGNARSIPMENGEARPQHQFFYREDDILHSLQLLAYLSKYPSLRSSFHTDSGSNVFAIVEKFTHRTMHPLEIQYWAGVIMRNACRKDDTRKGIRQCAYTGCGKWETKPREFAKCRRCRKAKYCSKQCQSKAWNEGHRWWCIEK